MNSEALRRRLVGAASLIVVLAVSGCGGGDGDSAPATNYMPLATGNRWVADDGSETRITGQQSAGGQTWWVARDTDAGGANPSESLVQSDAQGVRMYSTDWPVAPFVSPLIRLPATVGDSYSGYNVSYTDADFDTNGTADLFEARAVFSVVGTGDQVITPAGTFTNTLHLRATFTYTIIYQPQGTREDYSTGTGDYWYAPDLGPVKFTSSITTRGVTETASTLLSGYKVGSRTGGTLPAGD